MDIASTRNARVKYVVKLREDRRQRRQDGLMLVEGRDEIRLAISAGRRPQTIFTAPELAGTSLGDIQAELVTVERAVFEKMSYRDNPDGWLAVFPLPRTSLDEIVPGPLPLIIVAESVEKPGNLGAILRTADAVGATALLACDPRTDLYNPNVVRASRGCLFTVPTVETTSAEAHAFLSRNGIRLLAATPQAETLYTLADLRGPIAVAVGTEDAGLTDFWLSRADLRVKVPMLGRVNSLNVSIATALIAYEVLRQRGAGAIKR
jgi:TrmH family RNA methyltransferase